MLDVFCFKCLLHKQTLQVLPAYLNIKRPQNVLGKCSNNVFKRQTNNVIRTLYNVTITFLSNVIRQYKKFAILMSFRQRYNIFKTFSKHFCVSREALFVIFEKVRKFENLRLQIIGDALGVNP